MQKGEYSSLFSLKKIIKKKVVSAPKFHFLNDSLYRVGLPAGEVGSLHVSENRHALMCQPACLAEYPFLADECRVRLFYL